MKNLFLIFNLLISTGVISQAIVTVIYSIPVTVTYDPILGTVLPPSTEENQVKIKEIGSELIINAQATISSMFYNSKTNNSTNLSFSSSKLFSATTESITDASGAFRMSLPFAIGSVAVIALVAIIF